MILRSRSVLRIGTAIAALAVALAGAFAAPPASMRAGQANQGLQGGWAVDDSGNVAGAHLLSNEMDYMQQAGAGWVLINFRLGACFNDWTSVGCNGQTALQTYDQVVAAAAAHHLSLLGLLSSESWAGSQTDWTANSAEVSAGNGDNAYVDGFAQNAAAVLAAHFNGSISSWEVWNEPNAWGSNTAAGVYSGATFLYPSNFAWLLKRSYAAIKAAQPGATVISGGLLGHEPAGPAGTIVQQGSSLIVQIQGTYSPAAPIAGGAPPSGAPCTSTVPSGADYLCATYQEGLLSAGWSVGSFPFDAIGQHIYVDQSGRTTGSKINTYLQDVHAAYAAYEGQSTPKKTVVTEVGWSTALDNDSAQALNLVAAFQTFKQTPYVAQAYWFNVQDIPEASLYSGLVDTNGAPKESFSTFQTTADY